MSKTVEKPQGVITKDPELAALALMDRKLAALPQDARERILGWLQQKHGAKLCKVPDTFRTEP